MTPKHATMVKYTKRKQACGDMLQYFQDHPEKLKAKRLRDAKKKQAMASFADELEKISGFIQNVGNKIVSGAKSVAAMPKNTWDVAGEIMAGPGAAFHKGWTQTWTPGMHPVMKALTVGGFALQGADLIRDKDITGRGESRLTRGLRLAGNTFGGTAGFAKGHMLPSMALGMAGDAAGGFIGRKIDKIRGYKPKELKAKIHEMAPSAPILAKKMLPDRST